MVFSFAATLPLMCLLGSVFGDTGGVVALWASGPLGLLLGLRVAFRYRSRQAMLANTTWRWAIGGITLLLLVGAIWLAWQVQDGREPKGMAPPRDIKLPKSQSHNP